MGFDVLEAIRMAGGAPTTEDYRLNNQWRDQYQPSQPFGNELSEADAVPVWEQMYAKADARAGNNNMPAPTAEEIARIDNILSLGNAGQPPMPAQPPIGNSYSGGTTQDPSVLNAIVNGLGSSYSGGATQASYQLPPQENLERLGQPQENLDRLAFEQDELQRQAQYEADRQEGLRNYRQNYQYAPQPSFNESLMAYLSSQGIDNQRAQYEVDRQEGLQRFNNVYGGSI